MIHQRALCLATWFLLATSAGCSAVAPPLTPQATSQTPVQEESVQPTPLTEPAATPLATPQATMAQATVEQATPQAVPQEATVQPTAVPPTPASAPTFTVDSSLPITQEEILTMTKPVSPTTDLGASHPQVEQAINDLAARTSSAPGDIEVVGVEVVVWPDGGLGCPKPGMVYPQVQVDGLLIHLRVGGVTYEYHSGEGRAPVLCEKP